MAKTLRASAHSILVGGWTNPFEKCARQNGFIFPNFRGENKKYLKPPPSIGCMHWMWLPSPACPVTTRFFFGTGNDFDPGPNLDFPPDKSTSCEKTPIKNITKQTTNIKMCAASSPKKIWSFFFLGQSIAESPWQAKLIELSLWVGLELKKIPSQCHSSHFPLFMWPFFHLMYNIYLGPPKAYMFRGFYGKKKNSSFRWPKPLFFMVLGAHGTYPIYICMFFSFGFRKKIYINTLHHGSIWVYSGAGICTHSFGYKLGPYES